MSIEGDVFCAPSTIDSYFEDPPTLITTEEPKQPAPPLLSPDDVAALLGGDKTRVSSQAGLAPQTDDDEGVNPWDKAAVSVAENSAKFSTALADTQNMVAGIRGNTAEIASRLNAVQALSSYLDQKSRDGMASTVEELANISNFTDGILGQLFPENLFPDNDAVKAMTGFNEAYMLPVKQWSDKMAVLFGSGSAVSNYITPDGKIQIDLSGQDGSLDLLVGTLADALNAASLLKAPWASNVAGFLKGGLEVYKGVGQQLSAVNQALQASYQFTQAAGALVVAACEVAPALALMIKNLYDNLAAYALGLLGTGLQPPFLLKDLTFKLPTLPTFLDLGNYPGIGAELKKTFDKIVGRCGLLFAPGSAAIANANLNAFNDAVTSLGAAQNAMATGQAGVGQFTQGFSRSTNPMQKLFEEDPSMVETAPNRTAVDMQIASLMQSSGLGVPPINFGEKAFAGATSATPAMLGGTNSVDGLGNPTQTLSVPSPAETMRNKTVVAADQAGTANAAGGIAATAADLGASCSRLGPEASEALAKQALQSQLRATASIAMTSNQIMGNLQDPRSLSISASDYYYCLAYAQQQGSSGAPTTVEGMEAEANKIFTSHSGLPNSFLSRMSFHRPVNPATSKAYTAEEIFNTPEIVSVPASWYQPAQISNLSAYRDPNVVLGLDFVNLPLILLCKTIDDTLKLQKLLNLFNLVQAVYDNGILYQSHKDVLIKADQQGVFGNSPYVWLGRLTEILDDLTAIADVRRGRKLTYAELIWDFLQHSRRDLRGLIGWLDDTLEAIDMDAPIPVGLNGSIDDGVSEAYAAQQSYALVQTMGSPNFADFIIFLRTNSDFLGGALGFDYTLRIASSMIMKRIEGYLDDEAADEATTKMNLNYALAYAKAMLHNGAQVEYIESLMKAL